MSSIKQFETLKNKEFQELYKKARKFTTPYFIIFYLKSSENKVAFVASKKIGKAVQRNFAKRRLKALFLKANIQNGIFIFVARKDILTTDFSKLLSTFNWALNKLKVISEK